MKHILIFFFIFNYLFSVENKSWDSHSAHLIPKKNWEVGLFHPFRYGYSEKIEYSTHPLLFFVFPNIAIKMEQNNISDFKIATRLKLFYPTPLLNIVSRSGIGGLVDPNIILPPMLGLSGSLIASKEIVGLNTSYAMGIDLGLVFDDLDHRANIDLPIIYHRLGVFYNKWGLHAGIDMQKMLIKKIKIHADLDFKMLPGMNNKNINKFYKVLSGENSLEHKLLFIWEHSKHFRIMTGYKLVVGQYPYGTETRILPYIPMLEKWIPIIEFQWSG